MMEMYFKKLQNNNSITHEQRKYSYGDYHNNDLSMKFVFSGIQNYKVKSKEFSIYPDCFLILNKGTSYQSNVRSEEPVQSCTISFDSSFITDFNRVLTTKTNILLESPKNEKQVDFDFPETLFPLRGNLIYNLQHIRSFILKNLDNEFLLEEYLHHTYINYLEIYNANVLAAEEQLKYLKQQTKQEIIKRLHLAKEYIYCNYNQSIELKDIALNSYLSVNHLLRTFKQAYNESPHQFLTKIRLRRANDLIKNTSTPINEVVSMVGFECPSSFIRLYKYYYGTTPAKSRKVNLLFSN